MTQSYALVLEDDPKLGVIFQTALQQAGYDTDLDENGNRYRTLLNARRPDLVILDLHLPFAFGGDILNEIRAKYPDTIVAVVTADLIKAKTLTGKADHILIKPVSVASLLRLADSIKGQTTHE
jgi:DNA-binding response OmpR family regulator